MECNEIYCFNCKKSLGKYNSKYFSELNLSEIIMKNNLLIKNVITSSEPLSALTFTTDGNLVYEEYVGARTSSTYNATVWLADSDGKKIKMLYRGTPNFFGASSSPDGQKLAFRSLDSNLQTFDMQSRDFKSISGTVSYSDWPAWSPNGKFVVYTNNGLGGGSMILTTLDGNTTQVIHTSSYQIQHPTISPDGRSIAFGINYDNSGRSMISGVYVVKLANPIPEFPFAVPVLLISITSLIALYRIKIRK